MRIKISGKRLKDFREEKGLSQKILAELSKVTNKVFLELKIVETHRQETNWWNVLLTFLDVQRISYKAMWMTPIRSFEMVKC